jgi:hypothetical protein
MPRPKPLRLNAVRLTGLAIGAFALIGSSSLAFADRVGTAAAVQPDAFTNGTEMKIGNSIFFNQRINTTGKGLVQVLLVDGSTFTVGPGSDLVIDKFVYDPTKNTGQVVATLGKGVLRFVGGKISKNVGGVTVNTPTGALAIRGGMFQGKVDSHGSVFSFLFGVEMKFTGADGDVHRVYEPGYTLDFTGGAPTVRPTRPEDTAFFMKALSGGGQVVVGGTTDNKENPALGFHNTAKVNVSEITQGGSADVVQSAAQQAEAQPTSPPPPPPPAPPPPAAENMRVLNSPNFYTAFAGNNGNEQNLSNPDVLPGEHGILGGDDNEKDGVTADDFNVTAVQTPSATGDRLTGPFDIISKWQDPGQSPVTEHLVGTFNFPAEFPAAPGSQCAVLGICLVTDATLDGVATGGAPNEAQTFPITLKGSAVVRPGFVAYQLFTPFGSNSQPSDPHAEGLSPFQQHEAVAQAVRFIAGAAAGGADPSKGVDLNNPMLAIAGDKYTLPQTGQVLEFELLTDPRQSLAFHGQIDSGAGSVDFQNFVAPFATFEGSPIIFGDGSNVAVSPLRVLEPDSTGGRGVWLQTSFFIGNDAEAMQQSLIVVALGAVTDPSGSAGLSGERRGGSQLRPFTPVGPTLGGTSDGTDVQHIAFTGAIATLASANGASFLGTGTPNIVIGADSTGAAHNIFLDKPLTDVPTDGYASATYHVGIGSPATTPEPNSQTSGTFNGYAAGAINLSPGSLQGNDQPVNSLVSQSPNDVTINFDAAHNTLSATLITHAGGNGNGGVQNPGPPPCDSPCGDQSVTPPNQDRGGLTLVLGDPNPNSITGRSAFIDNSHYAAIETPGASSIQSGNHGDNLLVSPPTGYLVSGEQLGADGPNGVLFPSVDPVTNNVSMTHQAFCQSCDFLKWGAWGARAGFQNFKKDDNGNVITDSKGNAIPGDNVNVDVHLGWWVAGDVINDTVGALPISGTASYAGNAIGTVANGLNGAIVTYVATGNMGMSWSFGTRTGQLDITHFDTSVAPDGLHFQGAMSMPGVVNGQIVATNSPNQFTGVLSGIGTPSNIGVLSGNANGSFVGATQLPTNLPGNPQGVIGNWNVGNGHDSVPFTYGATGIFAGKVH